jgi:hypothetical protein
MSHVQRPVAVHPHLFGGERRVLVRANKQEFPTVLLTILLNPLADNVLGRFGSVLFAIGQHHDNNILDVRSRDVVVSFINRSCDSVV